MTRTEACRLAEQENYQLREQLAAMQVADWEISRKIFLPWNYTGSESVDGEASHSQVPWLHLFLGLWFFPRLMGVAWRCAIDPFQVVFDILAPERWMGLNTTARWFKVTSLSLIWRSLDPWRGHVFTIPKKGTSRIARSGVPFEKKCLFSRGKLAVSGRAYGPLEVGPGW